METDPLHITGLYRVRRFAPSGFKSKKSQFQTVLGKTNYLYRNFDDIFTVAYFLKHYLVFYSYFCFENNII
jgi:amino acid permease